MLDVSKYFPKIYVGILETDEIASVENEIFGEAETTVQNLAADQYVMSATLQGVLQYEKMLRIKADPSTETLDFRRTRVLSRLSSLPPFTITFLSEHLSRITGGNFTISMDYANYTLTVRVPLPSREFFTEVVKFLVQVSPANIVLDASIDYNTYLKLSAFTHAELSQLTHYQMREEVLP